MKETLTRFSCSLSLSELTNQGSSRKGGHHLGLPEAGKGVLNLGIWQGSWVPPDLCPAPAFYQRSLLGEGSRSKGQSLCLPESKTGLRAQVSRCQLTRAGTAGKPSASDATT